MHIHTPHDVSVTDKATAPTGPVAPCRLLLPVTSRTMAAGSSLTATEAHDADPFTLLVQILLVLAVLPLSHALVVMASLVLVAHPVRIAHVERLHPCGTAEVHRLPRPLVPQVAHPAFLLAPFALFGILQAPPPLGACATAGLQTSQLPERLVVLPLDGAHASPSDDESLAARGGDRHLVDFAQIGGGLHRLVRTGHRRGSRWGGNHQVQFIAPVPHQGDGPDLLRQLCERERKGLASSSHRQDQSLALTRDGLGRPLHSQVLLGVMGVAMARVPLAQLVDGLDIGQKLLANHLDRLAVQRVLPPLGFALQVVSARPGHPCAARLPVPLDTIHPHLCGFHLRPLQARAGPPVEILERIDAYRLHGCSSSCMSLSYSTTNTCFSQGGDNTQMGARSSSLSTPLLTIAGPNTTLVVVPMYEHFRI